ncbi:MAG: zinc-binding dehydrogenase [Deltaproteobacteria bacterium]|nr:zinc-binding dehydrogenase [Deltaproteobacteria bacterium]
MKAARFYQVGQPLVLEEVPMLHPEPREVLIRVCACGICGSDIHVVYEGSTRIPFPPTTLGHEFSGEIVEIGVGVEGWKVGDRVAVSCIVSCGHCLNCLSGREQICLERKLLGIHLDGGLAEYVKSPFTNLIRLPGGIPFDQGALLTDAVATPYHALIRRGRLTPGETVAIFGCGGLGIHAVQLAKISGAGLIIAVDVSDVALKRAIAQGADWTCRSDQEDPVKAIKEVTHGLGVDLSLELVGLKQTIAQAVASLRVGGRAVVAGLGREEISSLSLSEFVRGEIELIGSYAFSVAEIQDLVQMADEGLLDLSRSISLRIDLDDVNRGLEILHKKISDPLRVVVIPSFKEIA